MEADGNDAGPRPPPPPAQASLSSRPRAYTTGSMKDILFQKWPVSSCYGFQSPALSTSGRRSEMSSSRRLADKLDLNRRAPSSRRRHLGDANSNNNGAKPPVVNPSVLANSDTGRPKTPTTERVPSIRVNNLRDSSPKFLSPLILRKQRTRSLPLQLNHIEASGAASAYFSRQSSVQSRDRVYLGDSLCSIYRQPSIGSITSYNDDELEPAYDDGVDAVGNYNVSSTSSMCTPVVKLVILGPNEELRTDLVNQVLLLGDNDVEDEVFIDDTGDMKSTYISISGDEYHVILIQSPDIKGVSTEDVNAYITMLHENEAGSLSACEQIMASLQKKALLEASLGFLLHVRSPTHSKLVTEDECRKLAAKFQCIYSEMASTKTKVLNFLEEIIQHIQPEDDDMYDTAWRTIRRPTVIDKDDVDKRMLFRRFFWRTVSSKSCENLLAL